VLKDVAVSFGMRVVGYIKHSVPVMVGDATSPTVGRRSLNSSRAFVAQAGFTPAFNLGRTTKPTFLSAVLTVFDNHCPIITQREIV
jgi:hypothetical protein